MIVNTVRDPLDGPDGNDYLDSLDGGTPDRDHCDSSNDGGLI
jgi:hypothetical protein